MSVDIYFLIENGNAVDSAFVFRSALMVFPWPAEGQPNSVSGSLVHMSVYLTEEGKIFP